MDRKELETALVSNGIALAEAKLIAHMAFSPKIERLPDGWLLPTAEVSGSVPSKRARLRLIEVMRSLLDASISLEESGRTISFPVFSYISEARESQFIMYSFSPAFIAWAGVSQGISCTVN